MGWISDAWRQHKIWNIWLIAFMFGFLCRVTDRRFDVSGTRIASIFRGENLVRVDSEVAGKEEMCSYNESVLAPSKSSDWSNFLQLRITTSKSLPFKIFQHPCEPDWVAPKDGSCRSFRNVVTLPYGAETHNKTINRSTAVAKAWNLRDVKHHETVA